MHRALWPILSAALFLIATAAAPAATPAEVAQAEQLYNDGKFKESIAVLDAYLKAHPNDAAALVDRGDDYEALGEHQTAITDYTAAIGANPDFAYAYASRCESYFHLDQDQRGLQDCNKAIELEPKLAYAYRVRARIDLAQGNPKAALADANEALAISPSSATALVSRCRAYTALGQYANAIADCNAAAAINPNLDTAFFYRARAEYLQENYKASIADFSTALRLDPSDNNAYYWIAEADLNAGLVCRCSKKRGSIHLQRRGRRRRALAARADRSKAGKHRRGAHFGADGAQALPHRQRRDRCSQGAGTHRFARRGRAAGSVMADLPNFKFELEKASGWSGAAGSARQHTVNEFPVSTSFAAVSMRLEPGALRELHWHAIAAEWAYVVSGRCRVTVIAPSGDAEISDFGPG